MGRESENPREIPSTGNRHQRLCGGPAKGGAASRQYFCYEKATTTSEKCLQKRSQRWFVTNMTVYMPGYLHCRLPMPCSQHWLATNINCSQSVHLLLPLSLQCNPHSLAPSMTLCRSPTHLTAPCFTISLFTCMRTAGPRYLSAFHQYDGHEVLQQAHRMHSYMPSSFLRSWIDCQRGVSNKSGAHGGYVACDTVSLLPSEHRQMTHNCTRVRGWSKLVSCLCLDPTRAPPQVQRICRCRNTKISTRPGATNVRHRRPCCAWRSLP